LLRSSPSFIIAAEQRAMHSMTGYGRAQASTEGVGVVVEIQAVNKRQAEVLLNLPDSLSAWESDIRAIVDRAISRGRVIQLARGRAGAEPPTRQIVSLGL
jgi:uncharacterized protein (TIGR00255 family)